ncbi:MAG TPA: GDSL-type esterase/lipase family protein [Pseudomonadales bacterium]|nr:GDSL-type esterase/lipase family protein [Pseudomonadales bacterium]
MASEKQHNAIAIVIGVLLSLVLAEIVLRIAHIEYPLYPTRFQFGWPDSKTLDTDFVMDPVIQWKPKEYDQTLQAWRDKKIDIIHMGDSCTQLGKYQAELERLMQERQPQKNFHNLKLGVAGWSSYQGRQQLQRDIVPLHPRYVTIYFGWNDHWLSYGLPDKDMDFSKARFPLYRALQHARVFQVFSMLYNQFLQHRTQQERPVRVSLQDYHDNLTTMINLARDNGITPILITAPSSHRTGSEPAYLQDRFLKDLSQLVPLHRQYTDITRQVAREQNVLLLDLAEEFDATPYDTLHEQYMKADGIHLRPAGSTAVAEKLYRLIDNHHLLD